MLGNPNFTLTFADGLGGAAACIAFDLAQGFGFPPAFGVPLWVGGSSAMVVIPLGTLADVGDGEGYWSGTLGLPTDASLAGTSIFMQGIAADPTAPMGVTGTAGMQFTLFPPR